MPFRTSLLERLIFVRANLGPGPLLDLLGGLAFKAVATALELGVFEALAAGPADTAEAARRVGASERGLRFLLDALEPLGYVAFDEGLWRNTAMTERWLLASSESTIADAFPLFDDSLARWSYLGESIRAGGPARDVGEWLTARADGWDRYHAGMRAVSRLLADEIVARAEVPPGARRLLDLGGGHGLHAVRFCRRYPSLEATVLDLPQARAAAEETLAAEEMADRVVFREGDFLADDLGEGWDVVLIFNVARALGPDDLRKLLGRVAKAMSAGGVLVVMDQLLGHLASPLIRANARLIELELFNSTPGEIHRGEEVSAWIAEAGLATPRLVPLRRSGGQALLMATKG